MALVTVHKDKRGGKGGVSVGEALAREILGYGTGGEVLDGRVSSDVFLLKPASGKDDGKDLKDW